MQSKFTKKERLEIGRQITEGEINKEEASVLYDISPYTARDYLRLYKAELAIKERNRKSNHFHGSDPAGSAGAKRKMRKKKAVKAQAADE